MSLDPLKGFETRILFNFVKKLSILTQNFSNCLLSECWKGRRTRKRERFAPEIGAYHLTFLFLDFEFEEEKENLTSQLCSLSFNSNWALGPRWAEPTRARVTSALRPHLKRSVRPLCAKPRSARHFQQQNNGFQWPLNGSYFCWLM